ncbi:MAG TPA: hypothetical protein VD866_20300, partial [Urbifossiella sp.]|nr:hypothetical protein [Urbifossiella sp.]
SAAAESATRTRVTVIVPTTLNDPLAGKSARFRVRILAKRFGPWSPKSKSPVIAPSAATDGGGAGSDSPEADCDLDGQSNAVDTDDDNDLLPDTQETAQLGTLPCNGDTDGDTVQDGWEYQSALDLNRTVLHGSTPPTPYPGRRPFPNPLFPDAGNDFDGDGLTEADEHALWLKYGGHSFPLNYSGGLKTSVFTPAPSAPELEQLDSASWSGQFDGQLNDGERDADADGLANWDEANGRLTPGWWPATFNGKGGTAKETEYTIIFPGTALDDPDTDGDGLLDGPDDQDHDGLTNMFEVARPYNWRTTYISVGPAPLGHAGTNPYARTDPFNPCKPVFSATCHEHPPFGHYADDEDWEGMAAADAVAVPYGPPGATPGPLHP